MLLVHFGIEAPQKFDRLQVFTSTVLIGNPFAFLARIVQVEHGGNRVDPQSIHVILVEPEHGAAHQEAAYLVPPVVEDVSLPIGMEPLTPVGMLVQVCSVEKRQAVTVGREVRRHPIEIHTDTVLVQVIDQEHEILRSAVTRGRGEVAGRLVSPRAVEGMLHDRQEFHVSES